MATSHILYGLSLLNNNLQYFTQLTINLSRAPNHSNNDCQQQHNYTLSIQVHFLLWNCVVYSVFVDTKIVRVAGATAPHAQGMVPFSAHPQNTSPRNSPGEAFLYDTAAIRSHTDAWVKTHFTCLLQCLLSFFHSFDDTQNIPRFKCLFTTPFT